MGRLGEWMMYAALCTLVTGCPAPRPESHAETVNERKARLRIELEHQSRLPPLDTLLTDEDVKKYSPYFDVYIQYDKNQRVVYDIIPKKDRISSDFGIDWLSKGDSEENTVRMSKTFSYSIPLSEPMDDEILRRMNCQLYVEYSMLGIKMSKYVDSLLEKMGADFRVERCSAGLVSLRRDDGLELLIDAVIYFYFPLDKLKEDEIPSIAI